MRNRLIKLMIALLLSFSCVGQMSVVFAQEETADQETIEQALTIDQAEITLEKEAYNYTGNAISPKVIVKIDNDTLTEDKDYTLSYSNNIKVGIATITITGINNYSGSVVKSFEIKPRAFSNVTIKGVSSQVTYTGKAIQPSVTVYDGSTQLTTSQYKVSYGTNKNTGKATVTVTSNTSLYSGSKTVNFVIVPKKVSISSTSTSDRKITIKYKKVTGASGYSIAYRKKNGKWYYKNVSSKTNSVTLSKLTRGKYYNIKVRAYVTVNGKKYYGSYSSQKTVKVPTLTEYRQKKIVSTAKSKLGCRYVYGATGPYKFDCSGLTQYVYKQAGIKIPRTSSSQKSGGKVVSLKKLRVGDIVWKSGHVGIYVGNGKAIHAPRPGKRVCYIKVSYFKYGVRYF